MSDLKKYDGASDGIPYHKYRGSVPFLHSIPGLIVSNINLESPSVEQIATGSLNTPIGDFGVDMDYDTLSRRFTRSIDDMFNLDNSITYPESIHKFKASTALHKYNPTRFKSELEAQNYIDEINNLRAADLNGSLAPIPNNILYVNYGDKPISTLSAVNASYKYPDIGIIMGGRNYTRRSQPEFSNAANYHEFTHILNNVPQNEIFRLKIPVLDDTYVRHYPEYVRALSSIKEEAPYLGFEYPETVDDYAKVLLSAAEARLAGLEDLLSLDTRRNLSYLDTIRQSRDSIFTKARRKADKILDEKYEALYNIKPKNTGAMLYNGDTKGLKTTYSPYDAFGIEALKRGFKQYPTPLKEDAKRDFDMEAKRFILPGESVLPYIY